MKFQDFTQLYSISKTLRFELRPCEKTQKNIEAKGFLQKDKIRANDYVEMKKLIDEYHKQYINHRLSVFNLQCEDLGNKNSLSEYMQLRSGDTSSNKEKFTKVQENLRKQIAKQLKSTEQYKRIFKAELIKEDLLQFVTSSDKKDLIEKFKDFTIYFTGFHKNRENIYSDEAKSTAIAYRLIHDNLPKYIDNMEIFGQIRNVPEIAEKLDGLYKQLQEYLNVTCIAELFELDGFNETLSQTGIESYNAIIGGKSEGNNKIQGLNEYINLYNQQHKGTRLPKMKMLYKQILSDCEKISWLPEQFENDDDNSVVEAINNYYKDLKSYIENLKTLLENLSNYDLNGVFLRNDQQISHIAKQICGDWGAVQKAVIEDLKTVRRQKRSEEIEKYEEELKKLYTKQGSFSIGYLNEILGQHLEEYFSKLGAVNCEDMQCENLFVKIQNAYIDAKELLEKPYPENRSLIQFKDDVAKLKGLLDAWKELQHFVKPLLGTGEESDKDHSFYGELLPIWDILNKLTPLYNKVRNYVTRKPYSVEKFKLNFECSQLLSGWDRNKEHDCLSVILRKNGYYYLGIMDKANKKILDEFPCDGDCYEKMEYKLLPGANKMLPKVFFSKSRIDEFNPSDDVLRIYESDTFKKGAVFNLQDCHTLINFYKASIAKHEDWSKFEFKFSPTDAYRDISGFFREVEEQGYKLVFHPISASYIDSLVDEGKLYLFQIYNKDFSEHSKGTPNMHTLYWKMLFDEQNLQNVIYQLNGGAELFYRERSIENRKPTHAANIPIKNKNIQNEKKESTFTYDLIKDRRYTVDKYLFHVPITLNFKSHSTENINRQVLEYLHSTDDLHIIGIDRGERNLLYLVVIDMQGRICEQISLNEICNDYKGNSYRTNYHEKLDQRERERTNERQNWQTIERIKELKEGYLSQIVHKIAELMVKYQAIVVLEDLNRGFIRGRQKVEKSVYQKFEKMLIDKLNYLVDKKANPTHPGGVLNAYQLTNKFDSFKKLGKQCGFLFYVPAWNTSKIDPLTGFVNLFDFRYESVDKARALLCKFDTIHYNEASGWFEFKFDYEKFTAKAAGTRTQWTICTHGSRIESFRNLEKNSQWDSREVDLTVAMKSLFEQYRIDCGGNLKEAISRQNDKAFFERLLHLLRLTLQMRNSITGTEIDYILSPVADESGNFFDSRNEDEGLPRDADANGAYNIARKGLLLVEQIKHSDNLHELKFDLSNRRWLQFAQQKR